MSKLKTIVIGVGGASCSGKSTLCQWLATLFNGYILHQDAYFKKDSEIPKSDVGMSNWDCPEALDMTKFKKDLKQSKHTPIMKVGENTSLVNVTDLDPFVLEQLKSMISTFSSQYNWVFVDGFLLYHDPMIVQHLDVCLFIHAPCHVLKQRRQERQGYITLEGYWKDPPGYFDKIVWPCYLEYNEDAIQCIQREADSKRDLLKDLHCIDSESLGIQGMVRDSIEFLYNKFK